MAKLYVFGIGGTGSRVIKALTMLLATGVDINDYEVVPIIIDPDESNGDVTRTIEILKNYRYTRNSLGFTDADKNKFFKTQITEVIPSFKLVLNDIKNDSFKEYISYNSLDTSNKALINLLFSEDNLNADMEVGFKGNPNIGSIVLNQFKQSDDFKNFASSFGQEDRIFIVSSIFGGTGASGFPLLLKNIRNADDDLPTRRYLQDAPVGAITMLPYFGVAPDEESKIDKSTFISKTKAALSYYEDNVSGNQSLNALYYLGDDVTKDYANHEGSVSQRNDAHFLELAAALSIVDFAKIGKQELENIDGKARSPIYREYGIKDHVRSIIFENMGTTTQFILKKPLTQYLLFSLFLRDKLADSLDQNWAKDIRLKNELTQPFIGTYLRNFNQYFIEWLEEMKFNQRSFEPLNVDADDNNLFELVKGVKPKIGFLEKGGKNYNRYNYVLSREEKSITQTNSFEQQFMDLFYTATENLVKEKFNF